MDNKFYKVVIFSAVLLVGALLMTLIPSFEFAGIEIKKVDFLSDIRLKKTDSNDSLNLLMTQIKPPVVDTCRQGLTCLEDFSGKGNALARFYEALSNSNNKPVRIAYFGDSFIEGDILTGALRDLLKQKYGGNGAGLVPLNSKISGFRQTVVTRAKGWETHCFSDSIFNRTKQGISGYYFVPSYGSYSSLSPKSLDGKNPDTCSSVSYYFITEGGLQLKTRINKVDEEDYQFEKNTKVQKLTIRGDIEQAELIVNKPGVNTLFFGGALEDDKKGVTVDNFSIRGSSGSHLLTIPDKMLRDMDSLRNYNLIIIHFGLNVAQKDRKKYETYTSSIEKLIDRFNDFMPNSDILLIGVGDRAMNIDGSLSTIPGVVNLEVAQKRLAAKKEITFWNLIDAMYLDGGIVGYVEASPPRANRDYTHINFRGGKLVATHLFEAIEYGKDKYFEKKENGEFDKK